MVFRFLKKEQKDEAASLTGVLDLNNPDFVKGVLHSIRNGEPNCGAMLAIAYLNTTPLLSVFITTAQEKPDPSFPPTIDGFIRFIAPHCTAQADELKQRRFSWFYLAALIRRASHIAKGDRELENIVASTWVIVAEGCTNIYDRLKNNVLWSDEEKVWFDILKGSDEVEGINYCIKHIMPEWLLHNPVIKSLKDKHDII